MALTNQVAMFQQKMPTISQKPNRNRRERTRVDRLRSEPETPVSSSTAVAIGNERRSLSIHCFRRITTRLKLTVSTDPRNPAHQKTGGAHALQGNFCPLKRLS